MNSRVTVVLTIILLGLVFILGACSAPTEDPTATAVVEPTATRVIAATVAPSEPITVTAPESEGLCEASPIPELDVRPVDETDYAKGNTDDPDLIIYEYSDFQCPGCAGMYPVLQAFLDDHPNAQLVYRHFPLDFHDKAQVTAEAAEAAGAQGRFWDMHNLLFDQKDEWGALSVEETRIKMNEYAEFLQLDVERFGQEMEDGVYAEKVQAQYEEARALGLPGTPSFIFNNILFPSDMGLSYDGMVSFMDFLAVQRDISFDEPPAMTIDPAQTYQVTLQTSKGEVGVELFPESAPTHVNNFVFLAQQGWYGGSEFFFVQDNFVAVTGDPTNSTIGYPGYYCYGEEEQSVFDRPGLVGILSNGQFFITLGDEAAQLSGQIALIGQVTEGLDVLNQLTRVTVGDPTSTPDVLEEISIVEP